MNIVTEQRVIYCTECHHQTMLYFLEIGCQGPICCQCLIKHNGGGFPFWKTIFRSCSLCQTPEIHWYCDSDDGEQIDNCGNHDDNDFGHLFAS